MVAKLPWMQRCKCSISRFEVLLLTAFPPNVLCDQQVTMASSCRCSLRLYDSSWCCSAWASSAAPCLGKSEQEEQSF